MAETEEATATQELPRKPINQFALRVRSTSNEIATFLHRYKDFKNGWTQFRIQSITEKGEARLSKRAFRSIDDANAFLETIRSKYPNAPLKIVQEDMQPLISIVSDPENLLQEQPNNVQNSQNGNNAEQTEVTNPLLNALVTLKELELQDAIVQGTITKIGIVRGLGVDANLECSALIEWARGLAACFTYLLECKTTYSDEIKSKYAELLVDLNTARGVADKLIRTLGKNRGYLNIHEYHDQVGELLRLATIIRKSSLQLADYHEEFMTGKITTPIEMSDENVKWVLEGEEEEKPKSRPSKEEEFTEKEEH